jgi:DNA polymerase III sliding clamp (beta) subunit (PCNA family)
MNLETLYSDLKILASLVPGKNVSIPVCRALWSQGDYLVATDLEKTVMVQQTDGFTLKGPVDCKLFTDAVKAAGPGGKISQNKEGVNVSAEGKEQFIPFLDGGDLEIPAPLHFFTRMTKIDLGVDDLEFIYNARSTESVRYALTGVCFDGDKKAIIASDGKRLHQRPLKAEKAFKAFIMPPSACLTAMRIMKADPGTSISMLGISTADVKDAKTGKKVDEQETNQFCIRVGRFIIFSRVVEGSFPDWQAVFPDTFHYTICVDQKPFRQALVEAQSFLLKAKQKSYFVMLWLDGNNLKMMTRPTPETTSKEAEKIVKKVMERTWTIPVIRKSGYPEGIHDSVFNPEYLMDAQWNPETTTFQGSGKTKAACIDGAAVVMPLTLNIPRDAKIQGEDAEISKKLGELAASQPRIVQIDRPKRQPKVVRKASRGDGQAEKEPVAKSAAVKSSERRVTATPIKKRLKDYTFRLFPWIA